MRLSTVVPFIALFAGACAPQSAVLTSGEYIAFISESNSLSLSKGKVSPDDWKGSYAIDCRYFEDEETELALRLSDTLDICGHDDNGDGNLFNDDQDQDGDPDVLDWDDDGDGIVDAEDEDSDYWPPMYEEWASQDAFYVVHEPLEPWRGEAVVTSEGDFQVTFHHKLPSGEDFRFVFAIDRWFQPTKCAVDDNGDAVKVAYDGDWIDEWSKSLALAAAENEEAFAHMAPYLDDGRLYYLNGRGYQLDPDDQDASDGIAFWYLPEQWSAGSAKGKFSEELVLHRTPRYGEPQAYNYIESTDAEEGFVSLDGDAMWFCDKTKLLPGSDPADSLCMQNMMERTRVVANGVAEEMAMLTSPEGENLFPYRTVVENNLWRVKDQQRSGFDGWQEMYYNYVVFSADSDLSVGGSARGAFTLVLDAQDSATRIYLKGEFEIPKVKADRWTFDNLRADKQAEAGVEMCR